MIGPEQIIERPLGKNHDDGEPTRVIYEAELGVVIGKEVASLCHSFVLSHSCLVSHSPNLTVALSHVCCASQCKDVSEQDAADYVHGYTCVNDVTAPRYQMRCC